MLKLSVIIPVYNVEKYLRKCLDSVIRPQLSDYEIIIVNDGSTDSSPAIAEEYCRRFPDLCRMISTPNGGLGHARNVGLDNATGEYILFLDSDDYLSDDALEEMLEIADGGFDICFFDTVSVDENGFCLKYVEGFHRDGIFSLESEPALLLAPINACSKLFRRSMFERTGVRFPSRVWYEDIRTIPKLYFSASAFRAVRRPWYNYLHRAGSITNSKNAQRNTEMIDAMDDLLAYCREAGVYELYKSELEFLSIDHQLISTTVRVNLIDRKSPLQDQLISDHFSKFPDSQKNPYIPMLGRNRRVVMFLCTHRMFMLLNLVMRLNAFLPKKRFR